MQTDTLVSVEEFLEEAANTSDRIEYADGEIVFNMAGASRTHEQIVSRILAALFKRLDSSFYEIYPSNRFLYIPACNKFVLPDVMVVEGDTDGTIHSLRPCLKALIFWAIASA